MPVPWFFIRCPTCGRFWGERGCDAPDHQLVTPCLLCRRPVAIVFTQATSGALAIASVTDAETGKAGDWSPLLDGRVHWREVN